MCAFFFEGEKNGPVVGTQHPMERIKSLCWLDINVLGDDIAHSVLIGIEIRGKCSIKKVLSVYPLPTRFWHEMPFVPLNQLVW